MRVETPWVADIADLAELLRPFLTTNPGLAADDLTRRCLERPHDMARPSGA